MPVKGKHSAGSASKRRYELSDKFFTDAIREAIGDSLFSPVTLGEKHIVKLKKNFDTACWSYLPPHRIYIGTDLFEKRVLKSGLSVALQQKYVANHYFHELGHALYTERDMKRIQKSLKAINSPFNVYNLFEDAYIENRYRVEAEYRFEWLTLEDLDFNPRPESLLFALIQAEGDVEVVADALVAWEAEAPLVDKSDPLAIFAALFAPDPDETRRKLQDLLPRVVTYFKRIIGVKESMLLMPILNAWLDEFGRPPEMPAGGASGGMSDMAHALGMMTDPKTVADFDSDSETVSGSEGATTDDPLKDGKSGKASADENYTATSKKGKVLHSTKTPVDVGRAERLAARFLKFFAEKTRVVSTKTPQRRVSARHFALGRAPYRRTEIEGRGCKDVFLEIDCSGSMGGFHIMEGKVLITALSILAKKGHLTGHVALSAVTDGPSWELYKLPVAQEVIDRIQGFAGAEGLEYTLRDNLALLQKADYVFVYTDAQICDRPIDKSFFHRYGVYTWGLYAGNHGNYLEELIKYFDKALMRDNAEALVDAMLSQTS